MSIPTALQNFNKHHPINTIITILKQNSNLYNTQEANFNILLEKKPISLNRGKWKVGMVTINYKNSMKNDQKDTYTILFYENSKSLYFMGYSKSGNAYACSKHCEYKLAYKNQEPLRF